MIDQQLKINILAFDPIEENLEFSFFRKHRKGTSPLHISQAPKDVADSFREQAKANEHFIYSDFTSSDKADYTVRVDLLDNYRFGKHYFNHLILSYFKDKARFAQLNYINDIELWFEDENNKDGRFKAYTVFTLRIQYAQFTSGYELVIYRNGVSKILTTSEADLTDIPAKEIKSVLYNGKLYSRRNLPESGRYNLDKVYPVVTSVIGAIDWLFKNEDRGIILEDDCDASEDFFRFCKEMLELYKNEEKVMHISGENPLDRKVGNASYYFSPIEHCWGWATWKRAWDHFDPDMENFPAYKANKSLKQIFDRKKDIFYWDKIFDDIYSDRLNSSWAYIWTFSIFQKSGVCVTPNYNMISNLGFGKEATHSKVYDKNLANRNFENLGNISHPESISIFNNVTNEIMDARFRFVSGMELVTLHRQASEIKRNGDLEGARMIFNFVISFTEDQQLLSSALFHLGDIHRREGQNNKSLKFFEECLLLNPENNDARKIVEDLDKSL